MQRALTLGLCLVLGASLVTAEDRALSVFNVVRFPNDVCDADNNRNGTCFTEEQCANKGGSAQGSCADGFGVCCTFTLECGDSSSANNTYLVQASVTTLTSPCKYTICKADSDVSRIRLDFTSLVLATPVQGTAIAVAGTTASIVTNGAIGHCITDQFSVSSPNGGTPVICGTNTGYHMIVDASEACNTVQFHIGDSTTTSRKWDIWVTQYKMGEEDISRAGPTGCLQYYTGSTGYIASYGFPPVSTAITAVGISVTHLANQEYTACVRRPIGSCYMCLTPKGTTSTTITEQGFFGLSVGTIAATAGSAVNTNCASDFVEVIGGAASPATIATTTVNRICGRAFNSAVNAAHATVCTRNAPYQIGVRFDDQEVQTSAAADMTNTNEMNGGPSGIIGFGLIYNFPTATAC